MINKPSIAFPQLDKQKTYDRSSAADELLRDPNSRFFRDLDSKLSSVLSTIQDSISHIMKDRMDQVQQYVRMAINQ